jgi:hypothetical protein
MEYEKKLAKKWKKDQKNINFVPRQRRVGSRRKMTAKKKKKWSDVSRTFFLFISSFDMLFLRSFKIRFIRSLFYQFQF